MLKLTDDQQQDDTPDSYPFPAAAARMLGSRVAERRPADRGTCDAARRVEAAMREVEQRFDRLRNLASYIDSDPDRPRAA